VSDNNFASRTRHVQLNGSNCDNGGDTLSQHHFVVEHKLSKCTNSVALQQRRNMPQLTQETERGGRIVTEETFTSLLDSLYNHPNRERKLAIDMF
jgi:hypothetical protein